MTTQTEALKLALEALYFLPALSPAQDELQDAAIEAIKEALAQPEQEPVEDLQAKLKWATEQLEANINWEFVAAAKEEMLKAAWAEIKELREQIKEPEQEPVATLDDLEQEIYENTRQFVSRDVMEWMLKRYYTTPPQRKPLTDEEIGAILEGVNAYGTRLYTFARAIEAAHGIKEKNT